MTVQRVRSDIEIGGQRRIRYAVEIVDSSGSEVVAVFEHHAGSACHQARRQSRVCALELARSLECSVLVGK